MNDNQAKMIKTKTIDTTSKSTAAAQSGRRPRFKRHVQLQALEQWWRRRRRQRQAQVMDPVKRKLQSMTIASGVVLAVISLAILAPQVANCDLFSSSNNNQSQVEVQMSEQEALKVAALAGKLAQWVACRRFSSAMYQHLHSSSATTATNIASSSESVSDTSRAAGKSHRRRSGPLSAGEPNKAGCPASYDGHLCWPAARAGETVHLRCPDMLGGQFEPDSSNNNKNKKQPVIDEFELASDPLFSPPLVASPAPPKADESIKRRDGPITQAAQGPTGEARFASRRCEARERDANLTGAGMQPPPTTEAQWQLAADYTKCAPIEDRLNFDPTDKWIKLDQEPDRRLFATLADELDRIETTIDPYSDPDWQEQWLLCIGKIMRQQQHISADAAAAQAQTGDPWCPIIFDGWRCWPPTRASETAYVSCPGNLPGFSAERKAHKICTQDGTWYRHPMTNRYWSNYTTCVDTVDLAILNLYVIGNIISLVALLASLIIFVSFKSLNCTRVTIHKNLFLSFITNNLMWIIWYTYVVSDADLLQSNPIECQLWHVLLHYFLVSNYFWMFCEGLYLYTLLEVAFVSENKILKWFYLLGWLTPVPITIAYAYQRSQDPDYTQFCWMEESPYNQILVYPIVISLVLNFIFLINIVRVLVNKLKASNSNAPDTHQTRKAVRATLILIPLLGLHYLLTPMRPEPKSEWEVIYESMAAVCTSFQGLCVAMLFCFCNGEVINAIKRKLRDSFKFHSRFGRDMHQPMRSRSNTTCTTAAAFGYFSPPGAGNNSDGTTPMPTFTSQANHRQSNGGTKSTGSPPHLTNGQHLTPDKPLLTPTASNNNPNDSQRGSNSSSALTTITLSPVVVARTKSPTSTRVDLLSSPSNGLTATVTTQAITGCRREIDDLQSPLLAKPNNNNNNNNPNDNNNNGKRAETVNLLFAPSDE